jgi:hypothetical protein
VSRELAGGALAALVLAAGAALPAAATRHGILRDLPVRSRHDGRIDRLYPVEALSVDASAGTPHQYRVTGEGDLLRIRVGDPDRSVSGRHAYTIVYQVRGALDGFPDHDELYWNAVGTQWRVPMVRASATVTAPVATSHLACHAGQPDAWRSCASSQVDGRTATFAATDLGPAEGLAVGVGFPTGVVPAPRPILQERWSLARAFAATPATLGMAGLLAALLLLGWLVTTVARDRRRRQLPGADASVEAEPPEGLRPAQASLLLDREVRRAACLPAAPSSGGSSAPSPPPSTPRTASSTRRARATRSTSRPGRAAGRPPHRRSGLDGPGAPGSERGRGTAGRFPGRLHAWRKTTRPALTSTATTSARLSWVTSATSKSRKPNSRGSFPAYC